MVVTMLVQLIAVRLIFNSMGEIDYGVYSVVASIVPLFAFINVAMAAATQRFLSYAIGMGDKTLVKETFYISVVLHIIIAIVIVAVLETLGIYYINNLLQAPAERILSAKILLHCITISTFVTVLTVPYEADINANENMGVIAAINIFDSLMKLATAIYLVYTQYDKLIVFGVLTMSTQIITLIIRRVYCLSKYEESHISFHRIKNKEDMRRMASFAMWNFIGAGCGAARYQGTALLLNSFFSIIVNAAYGVAQQVNGLLLFFANTIVRAIRPQIVKSEGAGDRQRMLRLSVSTCRITSLMVALLAIPLFVEMEFVLQLWLQSEPSAVCVGFCRCFLIIVFVNQLTIGLQIAIESVGKIRMLQIIVGSMHILALPLGAFCFWMGMSPVAIMFCIIFEELVALYIRTYMAKKLVELNANSFLLKTVIPCLLTVSLILLAVNYSSMYFSYDSWLRFFIVSIGSVLILSAISYNYLLTEPERIVILGFASKVLCKLKIKQVK